jgi:hypothetical protein
MKRLIEYVRISGICVALCMGFHGVASAADTGDSSAAKASFRPQAILVSDFSLGADAEEKGEKGLHGPLQVRKRVKSMVDRSEESPEDKAKRITNTLADSIVKELKDKGMNSSRISAGTEPSSGNWLLEGEFVEYGEGDRLKRAVIGFGSGSASMEVRMKLSEVMEGGLRPLLDSTVGGKTGRMPGAVVTKNPYVAGAKYVMTKNAPDREVKKLGSQIADKLVEQMKAQGFQLE